MVKAAHRQHFRQRRAHKIQAAFRLRAWLQPWLNRGTVNSAMASPLLLAGLSTPSMLADVVFHFSAMPPLCSAVSSAAILP